MTTIPDTTPGACLTLDPLYRPVSIERNDGTQTSWRHFIYANIDYFACDRFLPDL